MARGPQPSLQVIEGGGNTQRSDWLAFPQTVIARSPFDRSLPAWYRFGETDLVARARKGHKQQVYDVWSNIFGKVPPVMGAHNYSELELQLISVDRATAAFRGLKRPMHSDDHGFDVVAYVLNPKIGFRSKISMSSLLEPFQIPLDVCYVVLAKMDVSAVQRANGTPNRPSTGVLFDGAYVECGQDGLPIGHSERYRKRLW